MYLRKTNDPRGGANFDTRAKIWTTFVEVHQAMFHVKYLSSGLYGLGGEDILSFQPEFCMELTALKELYARNIHTKFKQIWPSGLGWEVILMKRFTDGRTDGRTTDITV